MKRGRLPSSSEDSDDNASLSTTWSQNSRSQHPAGSCARHEDDHQDDRRPSELSPDEYYVLADPWRQEWEKGVQVPVSPGTLPQPVARVVSEEKPLVLLRPQSTGSDPALGYVDLRALADGVCRYDLNDTDAAWLELTNEEFREMGMPALDEHTMERVLEEFEQRCYDNMNRAIETEEGLGIEYDEDVVCDVCQSPEGEDGNEMVFCDKCNICVHQACYGILKVPEGSWLCRTCALGVQPRCLLCPKKGGAMKPTRSGTKWVHVSCALWIPEVSIGSPEKMEPITKVSHIPSSRWALLCSLCNDKFGASIQCSVKNCRTAFHVTCAFDRGLEMKTILADNDEVKFKSYCPKHSSPRQRGEEDAAAPESGAPPGEGPPRGSQRKQKLQQLEDEFYSFVDLLDVARALRLPAEVVDFLFQYWKLKRKGNFNQPLLAPRRDEDDLASREQDALFRRLQLFTHLRQDLERVRNLTYMVTRREKIKRSVCKVQEQIFSLYTKLLEQDRVPGVAAPSLESSLLFNSPAGPGAPQIEDLKWYSAFFRKQLGTSLVRSLGKGPRGGPGLPNSLLSLEKTLAEARLLLAPHNRLDPGARRHSRPHGELARPDARPFRRPPGCPALLQRPLDHRRAPPGPPGAPGPRPNGALPRAPPATPQVPPVPASPAGNWGGFRIPKKGEQRPQTRTPAASRFPCLGSPQADGEDGGYAPDDEEESEAAGACPPAGGSLGRGTQHLHRGILAS
ncbi:protein Jade-1 isoform X2 [Erinaceus europaeus]|uniref:Protein Jade-1 n=1 Tax=Erinaceus europaeus TaxID=9365 RepID=A0ABM3WER4_ERIEU|nr:protein Jade-1 isoform X2 [Erinaceus europaeus]